MNRKDVNLVKRLSPRETPRNIKVKKVTEFCISILIVRIKENPMRRADKDSLEI